MSPRDEVLSLFSGEPRDLTVVRTITGYPPGLVPQTLVQLIREGRIRPVPGTSKPGGRPQYVLGTVERERWTPCTGSAQSPKWTCPSCKEENRVSITHRNGHHPLTRRCRCKGCGRLVRVSGLRAVE